MGNRSVSFSNRRFAGVLAGLLALSSVAVVRATQNADALMEIRSVQSPPGTSGTFNALSYNVAGLPQGISSGNPVTNLPLISPKLNAYELVGTQEDFDWWDVNNPLAAAFPDFPNYHPRLLADATHPYRTNKHPGTAAAGAMSPPRPEMPIVGDGLGYLSRFPIQRIERIAWRSCFGGINSSDGGAADCLAMKGFTLGTIYLGTGADGLPVEVDVYNVHGEAGGTPTDQTLQRDGWIQLGDYIAANSAGRAVLLLGDTNLHIDNHSDCCSPGIINDAQIWSQFISRAGLTDTCAQLNCNAPGAIDKVAYRDGKGVNLNATQWSSPREFVDSAGAQLSDHHPTAVRMTWQATATGSSTTTRPAPTTTTTRPGPTTTRAPFNFFQWLMCFFFKIGC